VSLFKFIAFPQIFTSEEADPWPADGGPGIGFLRLSPTMGPS
jgi:hypothetical protein